MAACLAMITGAVFLPFARLGVDPHHDGIMLKPALDVLSGQVLYRDSFSQYGALTTYIQAAALAIEPRLLTLRLLTVIVYSGALYFLYLGWRSMMPAPLCFVAAAFFVTYAPFYDACCHLLPWSSSFALFFQSVALLALVRIIQTQTTAVWSWVLGAAIACTFWCRQPVGLLSGAATMCIALGLYWRGWRPAYANLGKSCVRVCLGFVLVSGPILFSIVATGASEEWWRQNFVWPRTWATLVDNSVFSGFARLHLRLDEALWLIGILAFCFAPFAMRRVWPRCPRWIGLLSTLVLAAAWALGAFSSAPACLLLPTANGGGAWTIIIVLTAVSAVIWGIRSMGALDHETRERHQVWWAFGVMSLAALAQLYPVPCMNHAFWSVGPGLGLCVAVIWRVTGGDARWVACVFAALLFPAIKEKAELARTTFEINSVTIESPAVLGGMRVEGELSAAYLRLGTLFERVTRSNPDRTALLYGHDALYLAFVANVKNPSPYYVEWPRLVPVRDRATRLDYLRNEKPILLFNERSEEMVKRFSEVVGELGYEIVHREPLFDLLVALPVGEGQRLRGE